MALLAALVVLDVIVVAVALDRTSSAPAGAVSVVPATPTGDSAAPPVEPTAEPTTTTSSPVPEPVPPSAAESAPVAQPPAGVPLERWIDAVSATEVWRAATAACPTRSVIERSVDGGQTWTALNSPAAVSRLNAQDPEEAFVVGTAGDECEVSFWSTQDAQRWSRQPGNLAAAWYLRDDGVHAPSGNRSVPCPGGAIDLSARTDVAAAVLCPGGSVHVTDDGARDWAAAGSQAGALALARSGNELLVAAAGVRGCEGVAVVEAAEAPDVRGCAPAPGATPGQVAVSALGNRVWLWVGDEVLVSRDGGRSWG